MSTAIHKYLVNPYGPTQMAEGARLLTVQTQRDEVCVWAVVDPQAPLVDRLIHVIGTGWQIPDDTKNGVYLATVQLDNGSLVFHCFDAGEVPKST